MRIVVIVTSLLLAAAVIPSACGKVAGSQRQIDGIRAVKFPEEKIWLLPRPNPAEPPAWSPGCCGGRWEPRRPWV